MIIEVNFKMTDTKTLTSAWEFSDNLWNEKNKLIKSFIKEIFEIQKINHQEGNWNNNIVFEIFGKPYQFYDTQNCFNDYFKSMGATILVD